MDTIWSKLKNPKEDIAIGDEDLNKIMSLVGVSDDITESTEADERYLMGDAYNSGNIPPGIGPDELKDEIMALRDENKKLRVLITKLDGLNRVKSKLYEKKIEAFIKAEIKATTSEIAEHVGVKRSNAVRIINRMIEQKRINKIRRGLFTIRETEEDKGDTQEDN